MATTDIFNFVQIDDRIGTGGQPTEDQMRSVKEDGYQVVINLAPHDADNNALPDEPGLMQELGLEYHHIPVGFEGPTLDHYAAFCDAMDAAADRKVLVHCAANFRVSAFVSTYAIKNLGWTTEDADALLNNIWNTVPGYSMDDTWQAFIDAARQV